MAEMLFWSLALLLVAAFGMNSFPLVRRAFTVGTVGSGRLRQPAPEPPPDLSGLPDPPVLQPAPGQLLDNTQILQRLRELEFGVGNWGQMTPVHEQVIAKALTAISDTDTQKRHFPRRPNLLPQIMRAINDEDMSRRQLAAIVARDPSLVGSLLKMANSSLYRVTPNPVESVERAVVILGSDGMRSLVAAAVMQPIFHASVAGNFPRFPELVWDHALRSAHAAIPHAAVVERADPFAAELLCLISGLAEIVLFRLAMEHFTACKQQPDPLVISHLLDSQAALFAWKIGASWELSELMCAALEEQMLDAEPTTPLGRSLCFGRCAGALAVLHSHGAIDEDTVKVSLPPAGLSPAHMKSMWLRLLQKLEDPRAPDAAAQARKAAARRVH